MATSDSFLIYIRSSGDFNFAVVASAGDDIASLKKKAEAEHLALFPHNGRIVSQAMKIWHEGITYDLSDNIPVRCLFDVDGANKRKHLLHMDAVPVTVPPDEVPPTGRDRDCSLNQNQGGNTNTNCASNTLKRKDPVVEEMTTGVTVLGEGNNLSKEKKSKEVDPKTGCVFAVKNDAIDAASADMEVLVAAPRVNEIPTPALKSRAAQKGSSVAAKGGPSPAASTSPITEDEIRKVLLSSANITVQEFDGQFKSRLRNKDDKKAFVKIVARISKLQKNPSGIGYVVLTR